MSAHPAISGNVTCNLLQILVIIPREFTFKMLCRPTLFLAFTSFALQGILNKTRRDYDRIGFNKFNTNFSSLLYKFAFEYKNPKHRERWISTMKEALPQFHAEIDTLSFDELRSISH